MMNIYPNLGRGYTICFGCLWFADNSDLFFLSNKKYKNISAMVCQYYIIHTNIQQQQKNLCIYFPTNRNPLIYFCSVKHIFRLQKCFVYCTHVSYRILFTKYIIIHFVFV